MSPILIFQCVVGKLSECLDMSKEKASSDPESIKDKTERQKEISISR
jgi:hypothetical protein